LRGWASGRPPLGIPWSKKSRKNSSKGEPGGNCGISGPECSRPRSDFSVCAVEIFTTDGSNLAARSAKLSGAGRAPADPGTRAAATMIANGAITFAALRPTMFDIRYDTSVSSLAATADNGFWPDHLVRQATTVEITGEARRKPAASSATAARLSADEPDEDNTRAGGCEPGEAQCLRRNRKSARRGPLHPFREQGIEEALDHQHKGERRPQIPHRPGRPLRLLRFASIMGGWCQSRE